MLESTTVVVRSDLDVALRSSRKEALVFARDWKAGEVAEGVKIVLASGAKVVATGVTNPEGIWYYRGDDLNEVQQLRVLAIGERGVATHQLQIGALATAGEDGLKVLFHTARAAYRPGEEVKLKLVAREPGEKGYVIPRGREFDLAVSAENGRVLFEREVELNDFGTAEVVLSLPDQLSGSRVLMNLVSKGKSGDATFQKSLNIEHGQVRRVNLTFDLEWKHVFSGEVIKGIVRAQYRWGAPLVNRVVVVKLPGGLSRELRTNELGEAIFSYPGEDVVGRELVFQAVMPGEDAEPVEEAVNLVQRDYRVEVTMAHSLVLAGRDFNVNVLTKSLDDRAVSRKLSLEILRDQYVSPDSILMVTPGFGSGQSTTIVEELVAEKEIVTDGTTGECT
ncbi:hypothetical protein V2O64_03375 [Verrucomicrobiaceae bacterium 227]